MEVVPIYHNKAGICFQWQEGTDRHYGKIQMVFSNIGFLLTTCQLNRFSETIAKSRKNSPQSDNCKEDWDCRGILLDTPFPEISLSVSYKELKDVEDLVKGTLFNLGLDQYLNGVID